MRPSSFVRPSLLLLPVAVLTTACGPVVIGTTASNLGGGRANAAATLTDLRIEGVTTPEPKVSPARLRFVLADPEADPVSVDLFYTLPSSANQERLMTAVDGLPARFATAAAGMPQELTWRFVEEQGIPADGSLLEGVQVVARVRGGTNHVIPARLGNDAPVVDVLPPAAVLSGVAPVRFRVSDSSDDVVDVRVEYAVDGSTDWSNARPGGLDPADPTPELAFQGIVAPRGGAARVFFWDTDHDLPQLARNVRLRFTPIDPIVAGEAVASAPFRIDNNEVPTVQLDASFNTTPDDRRGIPIALTLFDAESDDVRVLLQWRRQGQADFPALGTDDPEELARLVEDPRFVRDKQICRPFPAYARGRAVAVDATHVRLPELRQGHSRVLAGGVEFRQLELLRPLPLAGLAATWGQNQGALRRPSAALPLGDGITALVLDGQGTTLRLGEVDLATGTLVRTFAVAGAGLPTALALDADARRALVAIALGSSWQLREIDLDTGTDTMRIDSGASQPMGLLRAVLPLSDKVALATAGNALWRLDWTVSPGVVTVLRDDLAIPWGLARDPRRPQHILIAEHDADRIVSFDLQTRALEAVPASRSGGPALPRPTSIAIGSAGTGPRLVALCDAASPQQRDVRALNLGQDDSTVLSLGVVAADAATVATGPADLLLVALPGSDDLAAGGGVEQRRELESFDTSTATATVASGFVPSVRPQQAWRIGLGRATFAPTRATPAGTRATFVWDSREVGLRDAVLLRATSMDEEVGGSAQTSVTRATENLQLVRIAGGQLSPVSVAAADLDGDGDLDLVCANEFSNNLAVFFQDAPRSFATPPLTLATGNDPVSVTAADLDGDGRLDLVCANAVGDSLTVFFQDAPRSFTAAPPLAAGDAPGSVVAADLDGDGDLDLVCANALSNDLTVFFQDAPRSFVAAPRSLAVGRFPSAVAAADLDGDGDLDLVCANAVSDDLTVLFQDAPRSFTAAPPIAAGLQPRSVAAADIDGDGDTDLVCANQTVAGTLTVLFQDAPRTFSAALTLAVGSFPQSVAAADIDDDGDQDLVCANAVSGDLTVLFQDAPRSFTAAPRLTAGDGELSAVAVADVDGDGHVDLACANLGGASLTVFFQDAPRSFAVMPPLAAEGFPNAVAAADLDGDGDLDLVCSNGVNNSLTVFFQDAPRSYTAAPPLVAGSGPRAVAVADLDGDGDADLVCANEFSSDLTVFFQDTPRVFTAALSLGPLPFPYSLAIADLNGDGDLDLVCVNPSADTLTVFFRNGPRSFTTAQTIGAPGRPRSVAAADLDGDGDMDLVCANLSANSLTVFLQEAPGSFVAQPPLAAGDGPLSVAAADLDGDGDLDLVCANERSGDLSVFFQDGPRSFTIPPLTLPAGTFPSSVAAADLDGDGDMDLVCANEGSGNLSVFFQDAPRSFRAASPLDVGGQPRSLAVSDLDGDGDLDFVCANPLGDSLTVFFGR